jgi:hypothetical protein
LEEIIASFFSGFACFCKTSPSTKTYENNIIVSVIQWLPEDCQILKNDTGLIKIKLQSCSVATKFTAVFWFCRCISSGQHNLNIADAVDYNIIRVKALL